ncbi:histidine phosphatase family protein [Caldiplasma sukawensis]
MDLFLIRHGQTDWNLEGRWQGSLDIPLNERGVMEAISLREKVNSIKPDIVYSSDLKRAYETARLACKDMNVQIIKDSRLRERNLGNFEGLTTDEVSRITGTEMNILRIISSDWDEYGVEPLSSQFKRARDFLKDISGKNFDKVLIFSHGVMIGVISEIITGEDFTKKRIENGQIIRLRLNRNL